MSLKDRVAIITGASSGIGAATAIQFSKLGCSLVLSGRNESGLNDTISKCDFSHGNKAIKVVGSVTDSNTLKSLVNECINTFGKLNILVNNAGIVKGFDSIEVMPLNDYDETMSVNVRSPVELTQLCVPHLIKSKGCVVNVSSICGTRPCANLLAYNMSKAAIDQFTRCIALELASKGVRVNSVNPGYVATNILPACGMTQKEIDDYIENVVKKIHPLGRGAVPEEVAKTISFLASDDASFITGELVHVDGGRQLL